MGLEPGALGGGWVGTCVKRWGSARQGLGKSQEGRDLKDTDVYKAPSHFFRLPSLWPPQPWAFTIISWCKDPSGGAGEVSSLGLWTPFPLCHCHPRGERPSRDILFLFVVSPLLWLVLWGPKLMGDVGPDRPPPHPRVCGTQGLST